MAIAPLQLPSSAAFTPDITPMLSQLSNKIGTGLEEAEKRRTLADIGKGLADGTLDYQKAAGQLAGTGNIAGTLSLLQLGQAQKKQQAEQQAAQSAQQYLGTLGGPQLPAAPQPSSGDPRGIRNNNPLNLEASSFTQGQPGFVGSDGRFGKFQSMDQGLAAADKLLQSYAQRGINTVSGVINRWAPANDGNPVSNYSQFVARKVGVDPNAPIDMSDPAVRQKIVGAMAEFENGRPVQVASASGAVPSNDPAALPENAQPAQGVLPTVDPTQLSPKALGIMRVLANPNLPAATRQALQPVLNMEIERTKQANDPLRQAQLAKLKRDAEKGDEPKVVELFDDKTGQPYKATYDAETKSFKRVGGVKAPSGMQITTNPDGTVSITQGAVGGAGKLTEGQSKDMVFVTRATGALPTVDKLGDKLTNLAESTGGSIPVVGNYLKTKEYQQAAQAGREFLQAILRKDTGAAITKEETAEYGTVYLPQPGDSKAVLEQKKASRQRAVQAIQLGLPPQSIVALEKAGVRLVGQPTGSAPPAAAVSALRSNPDLKAQFDAKYGAGASDRALGAQ